MRWEPYDPPFLKAKLTSLNRDVAYWPIASFRCGAEFGRYRGIADFGERSAWQIYGFTPLARDDRNPRPGQSAEAEAGLVLWDDIVVEAAPIIGYMKRGRWTRDRVRAYCERQGWKVSVVHKMKVGNDGTAAATSGGT